MYCQNLVENGKIAKKNLVENGISAEKIWWKTAKSPKKFGGKPQDPQKNLVENRKFIDFSLGLHYLFIK